ncbi:alpha/beta hydrolase fold domain-containing protein [Mycolicibacterium bacteremicum]|uniref:alpha/beta hydrolase fold domain-containing protein n=1 Tax=Mycolicibacterium bacteremicum TaxID=564198 RepID=UPI0026E94A3A|nr:alpha/beta hydrolase fold domain-containing protein [Mycolicibacterium bacteremicum]
MATARIAPLEYALAYLAQQSAPLLFRPPGIPAPAHPVGPPEIIAVPTRHGPVRCFVYRPHPSAPLAGPQAPPLHIDIHGGGFVLRNTAEDAHICRFLAADVGCVVLAPDYHAAPQVTFPVAEQECIDILQWATDHADRQGWDGARISVGGASAGGKLSMNLAQYAHDTGIALRAAVLSYAVADCTRTGRTSPKANPIISPRLQKYSARMYFVDPASHGDPIASPYYDEDLPKKMPPTLIQTGDLDTLGPEMIEIAGRLTAAGVDVVHTGYPTDHAFNTQGDRMIMDRSIRQIAAFLLERLA